MNDGPITREEMIEMFGEECPIEAVNLIWQAPEGKTLREIRAELRTIAAKAKPSSPNHVVPTSTVAELLSCPFCGGEAELTCGSTVAIIVAACANKECRMQPSVGYFDRSLTEAAWNTRAPANFERSADTIQQLSAATSVPPGYVLVPIEPTESMIRAAHMNFEEPDWDGDADEYWSAWKSMIRASRPVGGSREEKAEVPHFSEMRGIFKDVEK